MSIKDKIFLFPFFVMFCIDLAVLLFFVAYLVASGEFQWTKIFYLVIVLFIGLLIYLLRVTLVGNNTVLDKFSVDRYFGRGLVGFVSVVLGILITTLLIVKTKWTIFINDFQKLYFEPLKWFEFLNNNYQQLVLYTTLIIIISIILIMPIILLSKHLSKKTEEILIKIVTLVGIFIIFTFFTSETLLNFWYSIFEVKIIQQILTYLFSGSLIYFNLFFLLKRPVAKP